MARDFATRIDYPPLRCPASGWWLTAFGALCGGLLLLVPSATGWPLSQRIAIFLLLAALPAFFVLTVHAFRLLLVLVARACQYAELHCAFYEVEGERDRAFEAVIALVRERQELREFRITHCYYYPSTPIIALARKRGLRANVGDTLTVIDSDTGRALGQFRISDDGGADYIAKGTDDIDPLWLGFMVKNGLTHSAPPPGARAMLLNPPGDE